MAVFLALGALSLAVALGFWWLGAPAVLPFAGVELLALGVAFALYARHAGDHEHITLHDGVLHVEHGHGGRVEHTVLRADWVRVHVSRDPKSLLALSGRESQILVGRYVLPQVRLRLATELRQALSAAQCVTPQRPREPVDSTHSAQSLETRS